MTERLQLLFLKRIVAICELSGYFFSQVKMLHWGPRLRRIN